MHSNRAGLPNQWKEARQTNAQQPAWPVRPWQKACETNSGGCVHMMLPSVAQKSTGLGSRSHCRLGHWAFRRLETMLEPLGRHQNVQPWLGIPMI